MNASRTYLAVGGEGVRLGDRGRVGGRDAEGGDGCDAKHRARGCGGRTRVGSCLNARTRMRSSCARGGVTISGKSVQHRLNFYQTECAFMTVRDTSVTLDSKSVQHRKRQPTTRPIRSLAVTGPSAGSTGCPRGRLPSARRARRSSRRKRRRRSCSFRTDDRQSPAAAPRAPPACVPANGAHL